MQVLIPRVTEKLRAAGISGFTGIATVCFKYDILAQTFDFLAGAVVPEGTSPPAGLAVVDIPACTAFQVTHVGAYRHLANSWSTLQQMVRYRRLKTGRIPPFEIYRNDPDVTPESELITDIYQPMR
ncbi:MAG: GyrI-like domain-containing protein [Planctomycetaceae bacterium]